MKTLASIFCSAILGCSFCGVAQAQNTQVKNLKPTGDMSALVQAIESAPLYPVFIVPLGAGYFDFELKASVDNFASGDLVYFYASAADVQPSLPVWDASPKIYFSAPDAGDARIWNVANPATPLFSQIGGNTSSRINQVVMIPSKITGSAAWMFKGNTHLVWSYSRISSTGPEKDTLGNVVWNPLVPVDWRAAQISP